MPIESQPSAALSSRAILAFALLWSVLAVAHNLAGYGRVATAVCLSAGFLYALLGVWRQQSRASVVEDIAAGITTIALGAIQVLSGGTSTIAFGFAFVPALVTLGVASETGKRWLFITLGALVLSKLASQNVWIEPTFRSSGRFIEISAGLAAVVLYVISTESRARLDKIASTSAERERYAAERAAELGRLKAEMDSKNAALDTLNGELVVARNIAEARTKEAVDFLSHMSHEIRTPLNGVLGITDVLLATKLDAEVREHVKILSSSGKLLRRLVDDVLELARLDAGKVQLLEDPFDPVTLAEDAADLFAAQASTKGVFVFVQPPESHINRVVGDSMRIR